MTCLGQSSRGECQMRERRAGPEQEGGAGGAGASEPTGALAALVEKLRGGLAGVRTAMRNRAVIEQAKGVLVERLGVSPDEGFDHLVRLSQRANIKLIEVAAAIVGTTAPDPAVTPVAGPPAPAANEVDEELRAHLRQIRGRERRQPGKPTPAAPRAAT